MLPTNKKEMNATDACHTAPSKLGSTQASPILIDGKGPSPTRSDPEPIPLEAFTAALKNGRGGKKGEVGDTLSNGSSDSFNSLHTICRKAINGEKRLAVGEKRKRRSADKKGKKPKM